MGNKLLWRGIWHILEFSEACPEIQVRGCPRLLGRLRDLGEVKGPLKQICCALETIQVFPIRIAAIRVSLTLRG